MRKTLTSAVAALGLAGSALVITAPTAGAAPSAVQSCYGGAVSYSTTVGYWPTGSGYARTSSACADINVKPSRTVQVATCFRSTGACNAWRTISGGTWGVAATNVQDGTDYFLIFSSDSSSGLVAD
ncbi:hypothetical protein [Streptomyces sp. GC420]|uniref:hypothetical protein n=1 Tax=Streptomyces sp. GC420 TaxID=2697568 RepID=UPI0014151C71|nr:hypothetical protein [Streptomyces sp. GC420]NBM16647.1 hypothetical protein [Streptomyces sp. GC420]